MAKSTAYQDTHNFGNFQNFDLIILFLGLFALPGYASWPFDHTEQCDSSEPSVWINKQFQFGWTSNCQPTDHFDAMHEPVDQHYGEHTLQKCNLYLAQKKNWISNNTADTHIKMTYLIFFDT